MAMSYGRLMEQTYRDGERYFPLARHQVSAVIH